MRTETYYSFSELPEDKQKALFEASPEKFQPDSMWYEGTVDRMVEALEFIGFSNVKIFFSGFYSQGDGACFTGNYSYQKGALGKAKSEYPHWTALHTLVEGLQELQKTDFFNIGATLKHTGHYYHELSVSFDFEDYRHQYSWTSETFEQERADQYKELMRDFMRHIYTSLEREWDYLNSWDYVKESEDCFDYVEISETELSGL